MNPTNPIANRSGTRSATYTWQELINEASGAEFFPLPADERIGFVCVRESDGVSVRRSQPKKAAATRIPAGYGVRFSATSITPIEPSEEQQGCANQPQKTAPVPVPLPTPKIDTPPAQPVQQPIALAGPATRQELVPPQKDELPNCRFRPSRERLLDELRRWKTFNSQTKFYWEHRALGPLSLVGKICIEQIYPGAWLEFTLSKIEVDKAGTCYLLEVAGVSQTLILPEYLRTPVSPGVSPNHATNVLIGDLIRALKAWQILRLTRELESC